LYRAAVLITGGASRDCKRDPGFLVLVASTVSVEQIDVDRFDSAEAAFQQPDRLAHRRLGDTEQLLGSTSVSMVTFWSSTSASRVATAPVRAVHRRPGPLALGDPHQGADPRVLRGGTPDHAQ